MRIAILVPLFPPKWLAGTEIATYSIAKHLAIRGYEVHVVTFLDKGLSRESTEQGFYVHRIGWQKLKFLGIIYFWLKILVVLRKIKPDIVHGQSMSMGVPGFIAKKLLRSPYLIWGRGSEVYLSYRCAKPIVKLVMPNADAVIALTEDMKNEILKTCNRNIYVIPNGIDLKRFEGLSKEDSRAKLHIKEDEKVIVYVGTLRTIKALKYLIQAMNIIRRKDSEAKLLIVGDGKEREYLEELVKQLKLEDCITFVGKVLNENIPEYMIGADILTLPSLSEGLPNVILEAMASGLPVVATKVGGIPEIVIDGKNGFLVEPKNSEQIAEKVLLLLENDELREKISQNNRERVKNYAWERIIDRLEQVYVNLSIDYL